MNGQDPGQASQRIMQLEQQLQAVRDLCDEARKSINNPGGWLLADKIDKVMQRMHFYIDPDHYWRSRALAAERAANEAGERLNAIHAALHGSPEAHDSGETYPGEDRDRLQAEQPGWGLPDE